jgi:hypothetical protein
MSTFHWIGGKFRLQEKIISFLKSNRVLKIIIHWPILYYTPTLFKQFSFIDEKAWIKIRREKVILSLQNFHMGMLTNVTQLPWPSNYSHTYPWCWGLPESINKVTLIITAWWKTAQEILVDVGSGSCNQKILHLESVLDHCSREILNLPLSMEDVKFNSWPEHLLLLTIYKISLRQELCVLVQIKWTVPVCWPTTSKLLSHQFRKISLLPSILRVILVLVVQGNAWIFPFCQIH